MSELSSHHELKARGEVPQTRAATVLRDGARELRGRKLQQAPYDLCVLMLSALLDCRPLDLMTAPDWVIEPSIRNAFFNGLRRLASGEPLQYVTGFENFMGRRFRTDARALIPRPESETLVLAAQSLPEPWSSQPAPVILDLGTGSGCLAVTLALEHPTAILWASDHSAAALSLARENAAAHRVDHRIVFLEANLLSAINDEALDILITNPPYIATADYEGLPPLIRDYEPRMALDGGSDGLRVIEAIISEATRCLRPHGWILIEIGHGQGHDVRQRLIQASFIKPELIHDVVGHERVVRARRAHAPREAIAEAAPGLKV